MNFVQRFLSKKIAQYSLLTFLLFLLEDSACWACRAPPREQLVSVDEQIMLASDVSVAMVVSATPTIDGQIEYEFLVQKRISGPQRQFFTLFTLYSRNTGLQKEHSFDSHQSEEFWQHGGGRLFNDTDCVIYPTFVVGNSYLTFVGQPITRRSFERIDTSNSQIDLNDRWLLYVVNILEGHGRSSNFP